MSRCPLMPMRIDTARLRLDAVGPTDAEEQVAAVNASLTEFAPWFPWAQAAHDEETARERLTTEADAFADGREFNWLIREHGPSPEVVGRISVFDIGPAVPKGEIGYWLATRHTGKGFMREAAAAVTNTALAAGFRRLEIRCDTNNLRSAAVPRALGYHLDGVLRNDGVAAADPGRLRHTMIFSRTT